MTDPTYLGDGVYAHLDDNGQLVLTTGHHEPRAASDIIYFEAPVVRKLVEYIEKHGLKNG